MRLVYTLLILIIFLLTAGCASVEEQPFKKSVCCVLVLMDEQGHVNCKSCYLLAKKDEVSIGPKFGSILMGQAERQPDGTYRVTNLMRCEVNK